MSGACKIVGASSDAALLQRCEAAMQEAVGAEATAVRSQSYYLDVTPPGRDKGTFVEAMARRLGISTDAVATIGDMQNDLAMFANSGISIAMGNATDDVKQAREPCHRHRTRTRVLPRRSRRILEMKRRGRSIPSSRLSPRRRWCAPALSLSGPPASR